VGSGCGEGRLSKCAPRVGAAWWCGGAGSGESYGTSGTEKHLISEEELEYDVRVGKEMCWVDSCAFLVRRNARPSGWDDQRRKRVTEDKREIR
jgi:hypothetical protein